MFCCCCCGCSFVDVVDVAVVDLIVDGIDLIADIDVVVVDVVIVDVVLYLLLSC